VALLKGPQLKRGLPQLLRDARTNLDALVDSESTDPFDSIYRMIFHFTMRTVACNEIADDTVVLAKCLEYFEAIEGAVTPVTVMYPWVPTIGKATSMYRVCPWVLGGSNMLYSL
jgi:sterol 14-demethylase